jgi:hypothetical protein
MEEVTRRSVGRFIACPSVVRRPGLLFLEGAVDLEEIGGDVFRD